MDFVTGHETAKKLVWSTLDNLKSQGGMQLLSEVTWKNGETLGCLGQQPCAFRMLLHMIYDLYSLIDRKVSYLQTCTWV